MSSNSSNNNNEGEGEVSLVWACQGTPPTSDEIVQRGVPACVEIATAEKNSDRPKPLPYRSLCLLGSEDSMNGPPLYCYQDNREPLEQYYFWWSPSTKCGTAWRLFEERKDDESWYKLPAPNEPSPMEVPITLEGDAENWLGWDGGDWIDIDLVIRPCQSPNSSNGSSFDAVLPPECFIPESATSISGGKSEVSTGLIVGLTVGFFSSMICLVLLGKCRSTGNGYGGFAGGGAAGGGGGC